MVGIPNNRRTLYTKKVIREEFLQILQTKELARITVKEICEAADINRGTFYKYYTDPYDLFQKIESDLLEDIMGNIKIQEKELDSWLVNILIILSENKDASNIILSSKSESRLISSMLSRVKPEALENFALIFEDSSPDKLDLYFTYFVDGTIGLIENWLKNYSYIEPKEIASMILTILSTKIK
ncbi:TetR/AcrR family transcriptional regulator [Enterococcus sp. BWM-S5]|uniref:TetR/AcrR family transcriptional regulator n=1 Tax=Enterococcus larvae TaxID=2794352 RepID=A0ABS4CHN9_9ENTE|nr:TetR/AcrR family transcriptional regulator [Enterococcus larvae]MBP1046082.1 TetR/AcrR family transcriptional regulator [Enterococcus larvae]